MNRCIRIGIFLFFSWVATPPAMSATLDPGLLKGIQSATFEVVMHKPVNSPVTYEKPLPLDQLPFQERNDKYDSIGTAFEISPGHYVTAFHVMQDAVGGLRGAPALRDASGHVYAIDQVTRFSLQQDFVEFTLTEQTGSKPLLVDRKPQLNTVVYAVGNALGTGVVIRDGLFTSETPEDQDGRWKWLRFSAAASPGNSGGPLLDADGKAIGVVLMKSANENLNFALPISKVLDASTSTSHLDNRMSFSLGLTTDKQSGFMRGDISLPLSYAAFATTVQQHMNAFYSAQFKKFLHDQADSIFPRGAGGHDPLARTPARSAFPVVLRRVENGNWRRLMPHHTRQPLPDNGYVDMGGFGSGAFFHLRKPDDMSLKALYSDPRKVMDLLLKNGLITRDIGEEKIKVTSFGLALQNATFSDAYQRHWSTHVFGISFANASMVLMLLPVPDGYAGELSFGPARMVDVTLDAQKILADFFNVSYDGSFAAWKEFMSSGAPLPDAIKDSKLVIDYGKSFDFSSPTISLDYTPTLQRIDARGELMLSFSFLPAGKAAHWQVGSVMAQPDVDKHDMVRIDYFPRPYADLGQDFKVGWKNLLQRTYPQNDQPYERDGMKWIGTVASDPAKTSLAAKPDHVYTVFYGVDGTLPDATMKKKLTLALKGVTVH